MQGTAGFINISFRHVEGDLLARCRDQFPHSLSEHAPNEDAGVDDEPLRLHLGLFAFSCRAKPAGIRSGKPSSGGWRNWSGERRAPVLNPLSETAVESTEG